MSEPNFKNRTLYHGDNLDFLRGLNSESVHLIATDPPFNKNRDFHATPDSLARGAKFQDRWSWRDDIHDDWLTEIQRDYPEIWSVISTAKQVYGDDMAAFLCWLGVRLIEMHRVLRDDGSLYLHIDHTAHAWVKCLLDGIFGRRNFRNEIVWAYRTGGASKKQFSKKHDTLLFYSKLESMYKFNALKEKAYTQSKNRQAGIVNYGAGTAEFFEDDLGVYNKVLMRDVWDVSYLNSQAKERTGYPTQKPLALYERIIKASSNPDDIVLDPFAGCATTPIAAERLGRQWIAMDIWEGAHKIVLDRLAQEGLAVPEGTSERLLTFGDVHYTQDILVRTDSPTFDIPVLQTPTRGKSRHPKPRTQLPRLLNDLNKCCQGCGQDYSFDVRVLEVDHINPRSQGGTDAYSNLTLLCPPCNKEKRDRYTLIGLQLHNRKNGWMKEERNLLVGRSKGRSTRRRR